jgi:hypothetical protein
MTLTEFKKIAKFCKIVYVDLDLSDEDESGYVRVNGNLPEYENYRIIDVTPRIAVSEYGSAAYPYLEIMIAK